MNRESNHEARLCHHRLLYSQRMAAKTLEQREARLAKRGLRDGARRAAARAAQSLEEQGNQDRRRERDKSHQSKGIQRLPLKGKSVY